MMRKELRAQALNWCGQKNSMTEAEVFKDFVTYKGQSDSRVKLYWFTTLGSLFEVKHITSHTAMYSMDGAPILEYLEYHMVEDFRQESPEIVRACYGAKFFECSLYLIASEHEGTMMIMRSYMKLENRVQYSVTDFS